MKKLISALLIPFFLSNITGLNAQVDISHFDKNQHVFWFYVKAEIKKDRELKRPVYKVRRAGKDIKSGKIRKYNKEIWRNVNSGQQLVIGPFLELRDAERSNEMYNLGRKNDEQMKKEIAATRDTITYNDYYWYLLQFTFSDRTRKYMIKRQPASVFPGSLPDFKEQLWDFLKQKQLIVGPFTSHTEAEESKRLYRLEESYDVLDDD